MSAVGSLKLTRVSFRAGFAVAGLLAVCGFTASGLADELSEWDHQMAPIVPKFYHALFTSNPVVVDGVLDDAAWNSAAWTTAFVDIEGDSKPKPRFETQAKMSWDNNYLYIAAKMEEPHVFGTLTEHDSVIFYDPDFEVFIDPDGDTHNYYEFEINALNTGWDLKLPKPYMDMGSAQNEWDIPGLKTAVSIQGTLNDASDLDQGWTVEIAFPWSAYSGDKGPLTAPSFGESWRINFSRVQWHLDLVDGKYQKRPETHEDNWVWSPQGVVDMHRPEMWGFIEFVGPHGENADSSAVSLGAKEREQLFALYYAQRDYREAHDDWATSLEELGLAERFSGVDMMSTKDGYIAQLGRWKIRQDRCLEFIGSGE